LRAPPRLGSGYSSASRIARWPFVRSRRYLVDDALVPARRAVGRMEISGIMAQTPEAILQTMCAKAYWTYPA
jgi:hypothetical protein